jgi:starch synthase
MQILHIASELAPLAKAGGLADMVFGLARATLKQGHDTQVIIPKYDCLNLKELNNLKKSGPIWSCEVRGIPVLLIEHDYFHRGTIYGCPDDVCRFIYFSRAVLEYLHKAGKKPDILHLHDWPTALIAPLYKEIYRPNGLQVKGVVLTIHNLEHQGKCAVQDVEGTGLKEALPQMQDGHLLNLLKGGIVYADLITTVSPTYEKEIQTPLGGCGLDSLLAHHRNKLHGILNGIDTDYWNPASDPFLEANYTAAKGKAANKAALRSRFGLKESRGPLVCCITRLAQQKGPELMKYGLEKTVQQGGQCALIGTTHDPEIRKIFQTLGSETNMFIHLDYDEELAHLTYAASDMILIPSIFEPCGLSQMIALRYGCIPIVRRTGGLADTIFDVDTSDKPLAERNGFVFDFPDTAGVDWALDRAVKCYLETPSKWQALVKRGMACDFSWSRSADAYLTVYGKLSGSASN